MIYFSIYSCLLISLYNISLFTSQRTFRYFVSFISRYLFDAIDKGTFEKIFFSNFEFCILTLYSTSLLKSLINSNNLSANLKNYTSNTIQIMALLFLFSSHHNFFSFLACLVLSSPFHTILNRNGIYRHSHPILSIKGKLTTVYH